MPALGAYLRIQPDFSLEDTARILSQALDVPLRFDETGDFEEFPAFSGRAGEIRFALLGPPAREYMLNGPYDHYELQVLPLARDAEPDSTLGDQIHRRIVEQGKLRSEVLS